MMKHTIAEFMTIKMVDYILIHFVKQIFDITARGVQYGSTLKGVMYEK